MAGILTILLLCFSILASAAESGRTDPSKETSSANSQSGWISFTLDIPKGTPSVPLISFEFNKSSGPSRLDMTRLFLQLASDSVNIELCYSTGSILRQIPLHSDSALLPAYFEINYTLIGNDSLSFVVFANGIRLAVIKEKTLFPVEMRRCQEGTLPGLIIEEVKFTSERPIKIPLPPDSLTAHSDSTGRSLFQCRLYKSRYAGEKLVETHWQIFTKNDTNMPIIQELGSEAVSLQKFTLGGYLDKDEYFWRVRSRNNLGGLSKWSNWGTLTVHDTLKRYFIVRSLTITELNSAREIKQIIPGEWYRINVSIDRFAPWSYLGYAVIAISDSNYPFGNPANKGGMFLSAHNYVANLSFYTDTRVAASVHEKKVERSFSNRFIANNLQGLYVDPSPDGIFLDTVTGNFSFKMRVLNNAAPGIWSLSAYVMGIPPGKTKSKDERFSMRFEVPVQIGKRPKATRTFTAIIVTLIIMFCIVLLYIKRKNNVAVPTNVPAHPPLVSNDLTSYLSSQLHREDLTRETIISEMKITRNRFYELLAETGKAALPDLLKLLRISKAKELLLNPKLTVSEIGYKLGFSNISYFIKVFRELEEMTPLEFREKRGNSN
ncbi:MAG: helix-turn-helix transcriptional regulator [Fibrobacteres bacterium]|nr:helix-turn-helix transcriptional regulator [Fibrobacterota bacterium]